MKLFLSRATGNLSHPCFLWTFAKNTLKVSQNLSFEYAKKLKILCQKYCAHPVRKFT